MINLNTVKTYNVGLYLRLSREDERADESLSIKNQKLLLTDYANEHGWRIADIYIDDGISGTVFTRPEWLRLENDIKQGRINLVLTKDLSRLGRNYAKAGYYMDDFFVKHGVRYIAINDRVDTLTEENTDMVPFKNVFNDYYARDISRKVRSTKKICAKLGYFMGSIPPYGYKRAPHDKHLLVPDEQTAPVIKRIFEMFASGISARSIGEQLNSEKLLSPRAYYYYQQNRENPLSESNTWNSNTVLRLLGNDVYIGNMTQCKRAVISYKIKDRVVVPKENWITVADTHEPIVSKATWYKVQELTSAANKARPTIDNYENIFRGLLKCADCGAAMALTSSVTKGTRYRKYKCSRYSVHGKSVCLPHGISTNVLTELVKKQMFAIAKSCYTDEHTMLALIEKRSIRETESNRQRINTAITAAEARLAEIERLTKEAFEDRHKGALPSGIFASLMTDYSAEQEQLLNSIAELRDKLAELQSKRYSASAFIEHMKEFYENRELTRKLLCAVIEKILIYGNAVRTAKEERRVDIYYVGIGLLSDILS